MHRTGDMRNSGIEPWWVSFSRVKSVAEAGAAADNRWCSWEPGYSCPSVLPSLEQVDFCPHVLQPWNDHRNLRLHVQVPGRKQEEHREGWSFCLVLGPKDALLFHTDSLPTVYILYVITMLSGHTELQGHPRKYFQLNTLSLWTKNTGLFQKGRNGNEYLKGK